LIYLFHTLNLCLVLGEQHKHYINSNSKDSIKQLEMMKNSKWFVEEILEHNQYIVSLLKTNLP
uniref:hypothetical protein n=1 Tax=Sphingobacterium multivorum TaxID=28454 RepID=UPI0028970C9E